MNLKCVNLLKSATGFVAAFLAGMTGPACSAASGTPAPMIVVDAHVDILLRLVDPSRGRSLDEPGWAGQANFANWRDGGVNAPFFAVWIDPQTYPKQKAMNRTNQLIDCLELQERLYPHLLQICDSVDEVRAATAAGRVAGLIGIEGGAAINNDLRNILRYRQRGVRYMTLTWRGNLAWAGSSQEAKSPWDRRRRSRAKPDATAGTDSVSSGGLTEFGRDVVREMNRVGMVVDLSHVSDQTFFDAVAVSERPVMISHSNARALANHPRNVPDEILKALKSNGGVIGINFWYALLEPEGRSSSTPGATSVTVETVLNHIDHIARVAGIDHVGIGSDYEGVGDDLPPDLSDSSSMGLVFEGMRRRGYSEGDIRKVAGENFLRVLEANDMSWEPSLE